MSPEKQQDDLDVSSVGSSLPSDPPVGNEGLSTEERAGLFNDLKNKLQSLAGKHADVLEALSPNVRKRAEYLRDIQKQHDELEKKFFEERATLETKYQKLYQPLYTKRFEIVSGKVEVEGNVNEAKEGTASEEKEQEEKGVPEFWLTAMKAHEVLAVEIEAHDEEALKYLTDIKWQRIDDPKGFKLEFFFDPNPFFKNSVLTKIYHMIDEDEPILERAIGTEIEWYPGKCLTQKVLKKKPKSGAKDTKTIIKTEKCESFFNFFDPAKVPEDDEDIDEDVAEQLQNQIEQDYDVGSTIRNKIIPHAISWFTGEADKDDEDFEILGEDDEDDEGDEDGDEEDEDDEEDDDDKDDGDEAEGKAAKKMSGRGANVGVGQTGDQHAECK